MLLRLSFAARQNSEACETRGVASRGSEGNFNIPRRGWSVAYGVLHISPANFYPRAPDWSVYGRFLLGRYQAASARVFQSSSFSLPHFYVLDSLLIFLISSISLCVAGKWFYSKAEFLSRSSFRHALVCFYSKFLSIPTFYNDLQS